MQFETERIMVRPFNMCDSEEVYEYCSDKEIGLLAGWAAHQSLDETKRTLSSWIEKGDHNAIVYKENNKVIGYIAIYPDSEENREDTRELGYAINKKFQGLGIMTEVLKKTVEVLLESEINNIKIVCMEAYAEFFFDYVSQLKTKIDEILSDMVMEMNTVKAHHNLYSQNVIRNRYDIEKSYRLDCLKGCYKDIPALVVSAGPSLQKNIEYIKEFKGVIFVGNRTIAPVVNQGKKPDFVVVADPKDVILDTTQGKLESDIPLIANDNASNRLIKEHKGKKYFVQTGSCSQELLGINGIARISMGGSVATVCVSAAEYMGCNPIIFIGQDCAYTGMKIYSDDCSNELINDKASNDVVQEGKQWIDEYYGGKVLSSKDLISFLRWIENFIVDHPNTTFVNATEGGALMKGAVNKPFKEVVDEWQNVDKQQCVIEDKQVEVEQNVDEHLSDICNTLRELIKDANKAKNLSEQLKVEYKTYKGTRHNKINNIVRKLDKIDIKIKEQQEALSAIRMIFASFHNDTQTRLTNKAKINETEVEEGIRVGIESYNLYDNIVNTSKELIKLIEGN